MDRRAKDAFSPEHPNVSGRCSPISRSAFSAFRTPFTVSQSHRRNSLTPSLIFNYWNVEV